MQQYAQNMPLHRIQHSKYAESLQVICKQYANNMLNMQQKYAKNMHLICRICTSLCIGIFYIYVHSPLCPQFIKLER